jgi:hypothetical protein
MADRFLFSSTARELTTLTCRLSYRSLIVRGAGMALAHASGR